MAVGAGSVQAAAGIQRLRHVEANGAVEPAVALAAHAQVAPTVGGERVASLVDEIAQHGLVLAVVCARGAGRCDAVPCERAGAPGRNETLVEGLALRAARVPQR